jgi:hypothetical protein
LAVGTATEELKDWLVLRALSHHAPVPCVSPLYPGKQTFRTLISSSGLCQIADSCGAMKAVHGLQ